MAGASKPDPVSTKQQRIAELAKQSPQMGFTSLAHHIDLRLAVRGVSAHAPRRGRGRGRTNGRGLRSEPARTTCSRCWTGPSPARTGHRRCGGCIFRRGRVARPAPSASRPLKTKCFNGRSSWCWKPIYEQDFLDCSYGFRPGRSAHQALDALWQQTMGMRGGWIVEVDIRKFFDTLDHAHLRELLRQRVRDGVLLRLIGKWLNAGVLEDGALTYPEAGTPQGGVDLAAAGQRLPALCAGRLVRAGGEAAAEGSCLSDPVRGRLRHGLCL